MSGCMEVCVCVKEREKESDKFYIFVCTQKLLEKNLELINMKWLIAQMVEWVTADPKVRGSNPAKVHH